MSNHTGIFEEHSRFINYYKSLLYTFNLYLKKNLITQEKKDIHQMRLCVKRLKAIWSLIDDIIGNEWHKKELFKLIKPVFSAAGEFREIQINLRLIESNKNQISAVYSKHLKNTNQESRIQLIQQINEFDTILFENLNNNLMEAIRNIPLDSITQAMLKFVQKKFNEIAIVRLDLADEKQLHKIRIHLKSIFEVLNIMQELGIRDIRNINKLHAELKIINEQIGTWHDYVVLSGSLKKYAKKKPEMNTPEDLSAQLNEISMQQQIRQQQIEHLLDQVIANQKL